jgi:D-alanyl-lipoteichoic acid acyltransferase DltB (MBOAT superfamily)
MSVFDRLSVYEYVNTILVISGITREKKKKKKKPNKKLKTINQIINFFIFFFGIVFSKTTLIGII